MGMFFPSPDEKSLFIFRGSQLSKLDISTNKDKALSFSGDYEYKPQQEREYIFEHCWKQVKEKFYVPDLHGVDWDYYHDNYAAKLPYINNDFDFTDLLSEMLGELNGSHTGARYRPTQSHQLGHIGILADTEYKGDGIKIAEVLPGGSLNLMDTEIKAGDIITSIEGHDIKAGENWLENLYDKVGKKILITVKTSGKKKELFVTPTATDATLLYKRWVRQREEMVEKLSGGKVGYVHIEGMDSPSYRELYSKALGKYRNCEALIVDTRHNGGGWLHDDLIPS
jgi:C-terminal processing protease CtpA/Prc